MTRRVRLSDSVVEINGYCCIEELRIREILETKIEKD